MSKKNSGSKARLPDKEGSSSEVTPPPTHKSAVSKDEVPNKLPEDPDFANPGSSGEDIQTSSPLASIPSVAEKKKGSNFMRVVKKIAFSVWAVIMTIGMVIAFLISLFLV